MVVSARLPVAERAARPRVSDPTIAQVPQHYPPANSVRAPFVDGRPCFQSSLSISKIDLILQILQNLWENKKVFFTDWFGNKEPFED